MNHIKQISEKLADYGLDAMLITSAPNRLYANEFASSAGATLVTGQGSWFFVDSRYIEAASRCVTGGQVCLMNTDNPYHKQINEIIARFGIKKMGFEESYMTVEEHGRWQQKLECELVPATKLLMELRAVKDEAEVEILIAAQRIAEKALGEVLDFIKVGRTEKEIAAFIQYRMLSYGAEKTSFDPIVVSGPNSSMPHGVPGDRPVAAGDFITMDFGCRYRGYCSDMTRTVAVGHVTEEMDKVYHTVLEAQLAGIAAARAGVPGKEVHAAAAKVIADAGYGAYFGHGFGHGLGVEVHEQPGAGATAETPLPVGAVISAEPGIYLPGKFGVRIEDVLVIGENGCRNIMEAPKKLLIL